MTGAVGDSAVAVGSGDGAGAVVDGGGVVFGGVGDGRWDGVRTGVRPGTGANVSPGTTLSPGAVDSAGAAGSAGGAVAGSFPLVSGTTAAGAVGDVETAGPSFAGDGASDELRASATTVPSVTTASAPAPARSRTRRRPPRGPGTGTGTGTRAVAAAGSFGVSGKASSNTSDSVVVGSERPVTGTTGVSRVTASEGSRAPPTGAAAVPGPFANPMAGVSGPFVNPADGVTAAGARGGVGHGVDLAGEGVLDDD
ncbi:hypothetical protein ABT106_26160, partial [Streptomyces sp. NPDC002044]